MDGLLAHAKREAVAPRARRPVQLDPNDVAAWKEPGSAQLETGASYDLQQGGTAAAYGNCGYAPAVAAPGLQVGAGNSDL